MPDDLSSRKEHPANVNRHSKPSKTKQTRAANQHLAELNDRLADVLDRSEPAVADGGLVFNESNEDVVIHRSDDHIGEEKYDEFGNKAYDEHISDGRIRSVTDSVMDLVDREEAAGRTFDTAHLLLGGDQVTGENIYSSQPHEICLTLDEQLDMGAELYLEQIKRLAARFPIPRLHPTGIHDAPYHRFSV